MNWVHLPEALPRVSIRDMKIHPREHDLIMATHGLGVMIIDDITPLRALTPQLLQTNAAVLPSKGIIMETPSYAMDFPSDNDYAGPNPPEGAVIFYYLKSRHIFGDLKIEIYNQKNEKLVTLPTSKRRGINRVVWNMRLKAPRSANMVTLNTSMVFAGPMVGEGKYKVKLIKGKNTDTGELQLLPNPITGHPKEDRKLRHETVMKLYNLLERFSYSANNADQIIKKIRALPEKLRKKLDPYMQTFKNYHQSIVQYGGLMTGEKLRERLANLYSSVISYSGKPSKVQIFNYQVLKNDVDKAEAKFKSLLKKQLPKINRILQKNKHKVITIPSQEEYLKKK
jgi:hypothetical protein